MSTSNLVLRARAFAVSAHGDQRYGDAPYVVHLDAVAEILEPWGCQAQALGYLHDTLEDTAVSFETLASDFGEFAAQCTWLVSDEQGKDRKTRKAKTHAKLAEVSADQPEATALVVKTADRLANVRACVCSGNAKKIAMYQSEHSAFRRATHRPALCDRLWEELDRLLESS